MFHRFDCLVITPDTQPARDFAEVFVWRAEEILSADAELMPPRHTCQEAKNSLTSLKPEIALLRIKVRTLIHEEISILTVLYFPLRVRTPTRTDPVYRPVRMRPACLRAAPFACA